MKRSTIKGTRYIVTYLYYSVEDTRHIKCCFMYLFLTAFYLFLGLPRLASGLECFFTCDQRFAHVCVGFSRKTVRTRKSSYIFSR